MPTRLLSLFATALLALAACSDNPDVLVGPAGSTGPAGSGGENGGGNVGGDATGSACVDTINTYRATLGLKPLARWTDAEACSSSEAQSDSVTKRAHGAFGKCGEMAQNECPGWPGPADKMIAGCLKAMWDEGPGGGHYENMRGKYTKVACGFHATASGSVWAIQNFK